MFFTFNYVKPKPIEAGNLPTLQINHPRRKTFKSITPYEGIIATNVAIMTDYAHTGIMLETNSHTHNPDPQTEDLQFN